jgi:hypothetical protein
MHTYIYAYIQNIFGQNMRIKKLNLAQLSSNKKSWLPVEARGRTIPFDGSSSFQWNKNKAGDRFYRACSGFLKHFFVADEFITRVNTQTSLVKSIIHNRIGLMFQ